jgi:hypothetical protein
MNEGTLEVITIDEKERLAIKMLNCEIAEDKRRITPQFIFHFGLSVILASRLDEQMLKDINAGFERVGI